MLHLQKKEMKLLPLLFLSILLLVDIVSTKDVLTTRSPGRVGDQKGTADLMAKLAEKSAMWMPHMNVTITPDANDKPKYKRRGGFGMLGGGSAPSKGTTGKM